MRLLHLLGRQMMAKTSADLWFRPTTPLGVAAEDAGAFGAVCGPVGPDEKKLSGGFGFFSDLPFGPDPVPSSVILLTCRPKLTDTSMTSMSRQS